MLKNGRMEGQFRDSLPFAAGPADIVLINGSSYAADAGQNELQAVAVANGRIVYKGIDAGIAEWIGPDTQLIDLKERMVLPGFHDGHLHPLMGAVGKTECSLAGLSRLEQYLERVKRWAENHSDEDCIRGSGWLYTSFGVLGPNKADLDRVVADRPVLLKAVDGHSAWANSKALELGGISGTTPDPPGGRIERDPVSGEPTGTLREWTAMQLVEEKFPKWDQERLISAFRPLQQSAARAGLTAVHDAMVREQYLAAYLAMEERGDLALRVSLSFLYEPETAEDFIEELKELRRSDCASLVTARSVKIFIDGVIEGHTAFLLTPYADRPDCKGEPLWERGHFMRTIAALDRAGFQIHIHAVGDGAVRMALDGFEHAVRVNGLRDSRHQIAHLDLISEADLARFRSLGVIANFQPLWFSLEAGSTDMDEHLLGPIRSRQLYPAQRIFEDGGTIACGSDWPVGADIISLNPLESIKAGLLGLNEARSRNRTDLSRKQIDLSAMLDFYTRNAAYAAFQENETGTIEVGKLADLVVLDRNLFTTPLEELDRVKVLLTLLEGKASYRDPAL
ncbi:MAG: amidohydrolase [Desulforhabdus sp.]|jgi:predicted amidohydrolase YtcJ|nr:amidohydrolase [Desulforhabdus sp.]